MAKLIKDDQEAEISDGEPIKEPCKEFGVLFGCEDGLCGTCLIEILEGDENLTELTQQEQDMDLDRKRRLACQCKIKGGTVKIKYF